jgi:riboflavin kinase / FMN adenylyltransferase
MKIFSSITAARGQLGAPAVALGNFDGVHLGHQQLFAEAMRRSSLRGGQSVALTFHPHPAKVLSSDFAPPLICPLERRLDLMRAVGLDAVIVQPFDRAYASRSADVFLEEDLFGALAARDIVVGADFTYGRARAGSVASLQLQCSDRGVGLAVIPQVNVDGLIVSSTKIRELVLEGRVAGAAKLLGRPFDLSGEVVHGAGRGQSIGFPTANLAPLGDLLPGMGVYAVRGFLAGGRVLGGAANIGRKPTFGAESLTVEVHLFDFHGELYGQRLAVEFLEQLRPEQRFPSVAALSEQIGRDIENAKRIVSAASPPGRFRPGIAS